jgi:hypothetical protein
MDYTFKEIEFEYAMDIKTKFPVTIWHDFMRYVFDYGDYYYEIYCVSEIADSQNKSDEAIIAKFIKHLIPFDSKDSKLVCSNKIIEEVYIVRTLLGFTTWKADSKFKRKFHRIKQKAKEFITGKPDIFNMLLASSNGGYEEITCHPKFGELNKIDHKYSNLIDKGLFIKIEGKYIKAFLEGNGFGFHTWNDKHFLEIEELKELTGRYEFIQV